MTNSGNGVMDASSALTLVAPSSKGVAGWNCQTLPAYDRSREPKVSNARVFSETVEQLRECFSASSMDERDVRRKLMSLHQGQKFLKVHKAVPGL